MKDLPKVNLKELKKQKELNFKQRLEFIDMYSEWLNKTSNKKWSKQQKAMIDINKPLKLSSPSAKIKYKTKKKE
ncbi:MAG TPA: hypothetical protein P5530_03275 [Candidatus Diapherotrites archaeon]|jgi:hypothetical protein|nr:hypothetical protein [Candidatus Diapherotrites archaeon]